MLACMPIFGKLSESSLEVDGILCVGVHADIWKAK